MTVYEMLNSVSISYRYELDDPEFQQLHKMVEDFQNNFTSPALGDLIPALKWIPTAFQRQIRKDMDKFANFLLNILKEHQENFEKSEFFFLCYSISFFVNHINYSCI